MKFFIKIAGLLYGFSLLFPGCIGDNLNKDCPPETPEPTDYTINVKIIPNVPSETRATNNWEISIVDLFIFDNTGKYVDRIKNVGINVWIPLEYPLQDKLHVVAVANATNDNVIPNYSESIALTDHSILLMPYEEFASRQIYFSPNDIFMGNVVVDNQIGVTEYKEMYIEPIVSKINIKVKGHLPYTMQLLDLQELPSYDDFTFVVATNHLEVNFLREGCGTSVNYEGTQGQVSNGTYNISTFNVFSSDEGETVVLFIYYKDTLIDTISTGAMQTHMDSINQLMAYSGKLLEIYVNYESGMAVTLQNVNWWGQETFWKDF